MAQRLIPGGPFVNETREAQRLIPGGPFIGETVAASGVSGTLAKTNANDTSAADGTTTVVGSLARTAANDTSAASGTTTVTGSLARTNANDAPTASGTTTVKGALAKTNADDTSTASGSVGSSGASGTLARTNANDTVSASGTTAIVGTLAKTNANDTSVAYDVAPTAARRVYKLNELPQLGNEPNRLRILVTEYLRSHAIEINRLKAGYFSVKLNTGTAAPTTGSWSVGDFVANEAPEELGTVASKYVIEGWQCLVAGSPGTWVEKRYLTGN